MNKTHRNQKGPSICLGLMKREISNEKDMF